MNIYLDYSNKSIINSCKTQENIFLVYQYFVHKNPERQKEIEFCLKKNVENKHITKIYLLNEKIYSKKELGDIETDKIVQINHKHRLKFKDIFQFVKTQKLNGYIVSINADIFLDNTIQNLLNTNPNEKKAYCQIRFDYKKNKNIDKCLVFDGEPRPDTQDTWIYHSNHNIINKKQIDLFNFHFGKPGCDNKVTYLLWILGYTIYNDPYFVKTFHFHTTNIRNYNEGMRIPSPYLLITPYISDKNINQLAYNNDLGKTINSTNRKYDIISTIKSNKRRNTFSVDNKNLNMYIKNRQAQKKPFLICYANTDSVIVTSICLHLNMFSTGKFYNYKMTNALQSHIYTVGHHNMVLDKRSHGKRDKKLIQLYAYLLKFIDTANVANVLRNQKCIIDFAKLFDVCLRPDDVCGVIASPWYGNKKLIPDVVISYVDNYLHSIVSNSNKINILNQSLEIFHHLNTDKTKTSINNWFSVLHNKNIVVISKYSANIQRQLNSDHTTKIIFNDHNIFKGSFIFSLHADDNISKIYENINILSKKHKIDLILTDCGILDPIIGYYCFGKLQISTINIGRILPIYFGLWRESDKKKYKDIIQLYKSPLWRQIN